MDKETVLIVGTGISASLARLCASEGMQVTLAARNVDKLAALAASSGQCGNWRGRERTGSNAKS